MSLVPSGIYLELERCSLHGSKTGELFQEAWHICLMEGKVPFISMELTQENFLLDCAPCFLFEKNKQTITWEGESPIFKNGFL